MSYDRTISIFEDASALEEDYQPDEILGREEEQKAIQRVFQSIIDAEPPGNVFLYGLSGLGKTATTHYELHELVDSAKQYDDINVNLIWQNCDEHKSSYQVAIALANQLLPENNQLPSNGLPASEIYKTLFNELDNLSTDDPSVRDYVIIVLDEADNIGTHDRLLYQIPRARANGKLEDIWPSLVGISNDLSFRESLQPKVKSSLCETEITFPEYEAEELQDIAKHRAEIAFKDGTVEDGAIKLAAAYGAKEEGDARHTLDLLRNAGQIAKTEDTDKLAEKHIEQAQLELERDRIHDTITSMGAHEHLTLAALAVAHINNKTPIPRSDLYDMYKQYAVDILAEVNASRRIHDYLSNFHMLGLINKHEVNEGIGDDTRFEYSLDTVTPKVIHEALTKLEISTTGEPINPVPKDLSMYATNN